MPLLVVHGDKNEDRSELELEAMRYSNISLCRARLDLPYGTHHTYVSVCLYVCLSVGVCLFRSVSCPGFICQISLIRTCAVNSDCYSTHVIVALIIQKRLSWSWLWSQYWLVVVVVTVLVGRGYGHVDTLTM